MLSTSKAILQSFQTALGTVAATSRLVTFGRALSTTSTKFAVTFMASSGGWSFTLCTPRSNVDLVGIFGASAENGKSGEFAQSSASCGLFSCRNRHWRVIELFLHGLGWDVKK